MPDNFGNTTQNETDAAQWRVMDSMRHSISDIEKEVAVMKSQIATQKEASDTILKLLEKIDYRLASLNKEFAEARGGLMFARWLGGIAAAISGAFVAFIVWVVGGGNG